jgi:hypothetical protein
MKQRAPAPCRSIQIVTAIYIVLTAGAGIFWNRQFGVFRAYVTRCKHTELVLVETTRQKIIISPADPQAFWSAGACCRS